MSTSASVSAGAREHELVELCLEGWAEPVRGGQLVGDEVARPGLVERRDEELMEQVHRHALGAQAGGERVVLLSGPVGPHDVVEQELVDVLRGQARELEAGPMKDGLLEDSHLRVDVERHEDTSVCAAG